MCTPVLDLQQKLQNIKLIIKMNTPLFILMTEDFYLCVVPVGTLHVLFELANGMRKTGECRKIDTLNIY